MALAQPPTPLLPGLRRLAQQNQNWEKVEWKEAPPSMALGQAWLPVALRCPAGKHGLWLPGLAQDGASQEGPMMSAGHHPG